MYITNCTLKFRKSVFWQQHCVCYSKVVLTERINKLNFDYF